MVAEEIVVKMFVTGGKTLEIAKKMSVIAVKTKEIVVTSV